jgi:hypothetical protein
MRPLEIEYQPDHEDIIKYEWDSGGMVRVWVGVGKDMGGTFERLRDQEPEQVDIILTDYAELMQEDIPAGKPGGTFRKGDLWKFVDRDRAKKLGNSKKPDIPETPGPVE